MSAPRKYDQEFRERAVGLYRERLEQHDESKLAARRQVGVLLDLNPANEILKTASAFFAQAELDRRLR